VKLQDGTIACVSNVRLYGEGLTDDRHIAIMRFDTIGELLWKKIVNKSAYGNKNQYNTDIAQLAGGNIIFNGAGFVEFGNATYKQDIYPNYIQCINVKGDSLWQNTFSEDTTRKKNSGITTIGKWRYFRWRIWFWIKLGDFRINSIQRLVILFYHQMGN
jgi:hypothetical protein